MEVTGSYWELPAGMGPRPYLAIVAEMMGMPRATAKRSDRARAPASCTEKKCVGHEIIIALSKD